jgi:hypothetical protein
MFYQTIQNHKTIEYQNFFIIFFLFLTNFINFLFKSIESSNKELLDVNPNVNFIGYFY